VVESSNVTPAEFILSAARAGLTPHAAARAHVTANSGQEIPPFIGVLASTRPRTGVERWATTKSYDPIQRFKTVTLSARTAGQSRKLRTAALHKALGEGKAGMREVFAELADPSYAPSVSNEVYRRALADFGAAACAQERIDLSRASGSGAKGDER
jgi:hypothetical protein